MFTNDFREEGLPGIGTQVLVNDITDKLEKGTFTLAYPLSLQRSDGRKSGGNTARDARAAARKTWLSVLLRVIHHAARGTRGSPAVVCATKKEMEVAIAG